MEVKARPGKPRRFSDRTARMLSRKVKQKLQKIAKMCRMVYKQCLLAYMIWTKESSERNVICELITQVNIWHMQNKQANKTCHNYKNYNNSKKEQHLMGKKPPLCLILIIGVDLLWFGIGWQPVAQETLHM